MKKLFLMLTAIIALALSSYAQDRTVHGVVVDETGEPLIGATVQPLGGGTGLATNLDGEFTLRVPASVKELQISYVGYRTVRVPVAPEMTIKLESNNRLEEVVVTGYGSGQKLGSVVGAIGVVGEEALENIPTANFMDALQGQVAGLAVASESGDPSNTSFAINIRGISTLNASSSPLFILDGAPITSSVFATLNPSDIKSITVLKDAASTAIYGSRAANGVIVITSKTGMKGEHPRIAIRANMGWSSMVRDNMEMMNSREMVQYRDLIGLNVPADMRYAADVLGINTDWVSEVFNGHAPTYSVEATISGGSNDISYYLSVGHFDAEGIIDQSGMRRETIRFSLNSTITDWLRIGFQGNLGYQKYETNAASDATQSNQGIFLNNPMTFARSAFPVDATRYYVLDADGKPIWLGHADYLHYSNIARPELYTSRQSRWRNTVTVNATLWEQLNPIPGLTLKAQQNVDAFDYRYSGYLYPVEEFVTPMGDPFDWGGGDLTGTNSQSFQRYYSFTYTNTAEYRRTFNDVHNMTALLGQESIISRNSTFGAGGIGLRDRRTMLLGTTDPESRSVSQSMGETIYNSFFLKGLYDYDSRYFLDVSYRRDGSSRFAPGHRWSNFYAIGAMWNIKAESFMAPYAWLNDLRLNVSYGTAGNSGIGDYAYMALVSAGIQYDGMQSVAVASPANDKLTWETVRTFDLGVKFGMWNILDGEISFYQRNTDDMLMSIPYSYTTGFGAGIGNVGNLRNTGVDVRIGADVVRTKDWFVNISANFAYNKNKITKLYDGQDELVLEGTGTKYQVGHPAGDFYLVRWAGVDPMDGQQMWYDKDGNLTKVFNEADDAVLVGKSCYAPWNGGFGATASWKGLSLRLDFAWSLGKYMINNDRYFAENSNMASQFNQMKRMLNVWTTPGQITNIPAADGQSTQFDTHLLENSSYMRMKNITLSYSLPQNLLNKMYLQNVTFHFTGRNLLTFSNFTGYDPEPVTNIMQFRYPNTRQYEIGLEVVF